MANNAGIGKICLSKSSGGQLYDQVRRFQSLLQSCPTNLKLVPVFHLSCVYKSTKQAPWVKSELKLEDLDQKRKESDEDERKKGEEAWKRLKYSLGALFATVGVTGAAMTYSMGKPRVDDMGNLISDEFSHMWIIPQYFWRMAKEVEFYGKMIKEPSRSKLLPDPVKHPYIQPPYTLVLELTDLLVHPEWTYQTGWRFKKRPGVDKFLEQVGPPNFEIVVYTAEQGLTVFPILDSLDPKGYIMYRLVRDATDYIDGHHVKNLDHLNRDLKRVIVVDWNRNSVKLHENNAFFLPRWNGNDDDTTLAELASFLRTIVVSEVDDVRETLIYYGQFDNPIEAFKENQRKVLQQMEEQDKVKKSQDKALVSRWASTFLHR